jgi:hypothetical protein
MLEVSPTRTPAMGGKGLQPKPSRKQWIVTGVAALLAFTMWFYVNAILVPYQKADAARAGRPRGNLSDLYPRWVGARDLLLHGEDPYGRAATLKAQEGYYGRALDPARPNDPRDQQGFAYPVYVVFLIAPTVHMDFSVVQEVFRWILLGLTVATALLWVAALGWRPRAPMLLAIELLTVGSFPAAQGIKLQQLSLFVSALIAAAVAALVAGLPATAGVLLAIATVKPQITVPLAVCLGIWAFGDLRRRWTFLAGFLVTLAVLVIAGEFVLSGWMKEFWHAVGDYRQYTGGVSLLEAVAGRGGGLLLTVPLLLVVGWAFAKLRTADAKSGEFRLLVAVVLAVTVVIIPTWAPYNQLLLLPGVLLLLRHWRVIMRASSAARLMYMVTILVLAWPWAASLALTVLSPMLPADKVQQLWALPLYTSIPIPLAVTAMLVWRLLQPHAEGRRFRLKAAGVPQ